MQSQESAESVIDYVNKSGLVSLKHGDQLVIVARRSNEVGNVLDDQRLAAKVFMVGNAPAIERPVKACSSSFCLPFQSARCSPCCFSKSQSL